MSVKSRQNKLHIHKLLMLQNRSLGAIQVLRSAMGGGCQLSREKELRWCKVQCY